MELSRIGRADVGDLSDRDSDEDDLELISDLSDESSIKMVMTKETGQDKEKRLQRIEGRIDTKLKSFLMKWIVITIFY